MAASGTDISVSLLIPTWNEADHIESCLASVVAQTHPLDRMEVLVIDGGSTDATVDLVRSWTDRIPLLRLIDNPKRIQAAALNLGLVAAANDLIVRMDAHSTYADDYVAASIAAYERSGATVVGGPMRPRGTTRFGDAVAVATTSRVGVGPGQFHFDDAAGDVDTVYLGTFNRHDIVRLGGYDEDFAIGEDHELNLRVTRSGGRIVLDPTIVSWYTPRATVGALWQQYRRYGQAKAATLRKHGRFPSWRPLAPAALVAGAVVSLGSLFTPFRKWIWIPWVGYLGIVVGTALRLGNFARTAAAMVTMHVSYGVGLWGSLLGTRKRR